MDRHIVDMIDEIMDVVDFDSDKPIKVLKSSDGRDVVLIRSNPFTITRIYVTGRPDGKRPHGRDSYYDYFMEQHEDYVRKHGSDEGFALTAEDWTALFNEATDRYLRYLIFASIKRWEDVKRDTTINIRLSDFAKKYAPSEIAWQIYQYKGYMLMMRAIANAELKLMKIDYVGAIEELDKGISEIGKFCAECLREGHEEAEAITRDKYLSNLVQYRNDIQSVGEKLSSGELNEISWEELDELLAEEEEEE